MLTTFWLNLPYMTQHSDEFLPKDRKHLVSEKNTVLYAKWMQPKPMKRPVEAECENGSLHW